MFRLLVVFIIMSISMDANQLVVTTDTLHHDTSLRVSKTFCPRCEAWNDVFAPDFTGKIPTEFHMSIFDQNGMEIFSTENFEYGWSGLIKEGDQQILQFTWKMVYRYEKDGPLYECSGNLALIQ